VLGRRGSSPLFQVVKKGFWASHLGEGYNPCLLFLFLGRKICLKRTRKKQAKRERFLKRMKTAHTRANVEKVRRLREAQALLANASP